MVKRVVWAAACMLAWAPLPAAEPGSAASLASALGDAWRGLPDWRGYWYLEGPLVFGGPAHAMVPADAVPGQHVVRGIEFAQGVPAGAYLVRVPYRPAFQQRYDATVAAAKARGVAADPVEDCPRGYGMPRLMGAGPGAVQFHLMPAGTWMIWDTFDQTRRIPTDGRPASAAGRGMGQSAGRWEGVTLVIETTGMPAGILDRTGAPHSAALRLTERITRTDADTLTVEMTLEDAEAFTAPWYLVRRFKRSLEPQWSPRPVHCAAPAAAGAVP